MKCKYYDEGTEYGNHCDCDGDIPDRWKTERGFAYYEAIDLYGKTFSIQKSSLATEDAIWFGINDFQPMILASKIINGGCGWAKYPLPEGVEACTRMHLSRKQVECLLPILQKFVETCVI